MEQVIANIAHITFAATGAFFAVLAIAAGVWFGTLAIWNFLQSIRMNFEDYPVFTILAVLFMLFMTSGLVDAVYRGSG